MENGNKFNREGGSLSYEAIVYMIQKITQQEYDKLIDSENNGRYEPLGQFYLKDGELYIGVDNRDGCAWVEEFKSLSTCKRWLQE